MVSLERGQTIERVLCSVWNVDKTQVTHDRQRGLITFLRIYSGTLHAKENLQNCTRGLKERPLQLLEVRHAAVTTCVALEDSELPVPSLARP